MATARTALRSLSPLLLAGLSLAALLAGCGDDDHFGATTTPLRILVTNDDGIGAEGIDALVAALVADPRNEVIVCAPDGNRSGTTDMTGPSARCGDLSVTAGTTLGGHPGTAMNGCPADTVVYALANLYPAAAPPHVVLSGINEGQNVSRPIATRVSGTVGAARTAGRNGIPALAVSQGSPAAGGTYAYATAVATTLDWLEEHRAALLAAAVAPDPIDSINVPSCAPGLEVRGLLAGLPLATLGNGAFDAQDCASTLAAPRDDVEAFRNGFITLTAVPLANG